MGIVPTVRGETGTSGAGIAGRSATGISESMAGASLAGNDSWDASSTQDGTAAVAGASSRASAVAGADRNPSLAASNDSPPLS